ncbi:hypothetical protein FE257_000231 [Aspergillus nanangensis]|uniref:Alpha/beta hydrolase fold-3 domain-containing protein n=1 Tax=Aspergillus nanangensis TaxID=2582783 RepID=A0AAD4CZE2_ASPNN|nr:hypothetical protein FE257_000231 [Aspergillus nanangensis]
MDTIAEPNPVPTITVGDIFQTGLTLCIRLPWTVIATLCRRWSPWSTYKPPPLREHLFRHVMTCFGNKIPLSIWQRFSGDHAGDNLATSIRYAHLHPQLFQSVRTPSFAGYWICRGLAADPIAPRDADVVILHCHGGGYVAGHPSACAPELALSAEILHRRGLTAAIFSLDYTLAPKARFPRQREEILAVYDWLCGEMGVNNGRIVVMGDSAGGHLVVSLLVGLYQRSRERGLAAGKPRAALLISPWLNLHTDHPKMMALHWEERLFKMSLDSYREMLFRGVEDPELDRVYGNFGAAEEMRGSWQEILPSRTWVSAGEDELAFRYDMEDFVEAARRDGAEVAFDVEQGKDHTWQCSEAYQQHAQLLGATMDVDDANVMAGYRRVAREIVRRCVV